MAFENEKDKIGLKTKVDLTSWKTIFKTFQKKKMNIIIECEDPDIGSFTIGMVKRVTDKSVFILYFDAAGFFDDKPIRIDYSEISKIMFDDRYIDIFSKYTRERKKKKTTANNVYDSWSDALHFWLPSEKLNQNRKAYHEVIYVTCASCKNEQTTNHIDFPFTDK